MPGIPQRMRWVLAAQPGLLVLVVAMTPSSPPDFAAVRRTAPTSEARLLARDGRLLEIRRTDPGARPLDWLPLAGISGALTSRTVASEHRRFRDHHGVDWRAVGGALRDRLQGRRNRGASAITMQLAALVNPPSARPASGRGGRRSCRCAPR